MHENDDDDDDDALAILFADLKVRGLATEADYDLATDALASGAMTEAEVIAHWQPQPQPQGEDAPDDDDINNLGMCHKHASDFEKAVGAYEEAFKLCPIMPKLCPGPDSDRCRDPIQGVYEPVASASVRRSIGSHCTQRGAEGKGNRGSTVRVRLASNGYAHSNTLQQPWRCHPGRLRPSAWALKQA